MLFPHTPTFTQTCSPCHASPHGLPILIGGLCESRVYRMLTRRGMGDLSLRLGGDPLLCDNITSFRGFMAVLDFYQWKISQAA